MVQLLSETIFARTRGVILTDWTGAIPTSVDPSPRSMDQSHRRGVILAAARDLFAERGQSNVTVRSLAKRSGVTPPTIYNLIGGRDVVLEGALLQSLKGCLELAPALAKQTNTNPIVALADIFWLAAHSDPSFAKHQIDLNTKYLEGRRIGRAFSSRTAQMISVWLEDIQDRDRMRGGITPDSIAAAIESQFRIVAMDWADGYDSLYAFRRRLAFGAVNNLVNFVDRREADKMMQWLDLINAPAPPLDSPAQSIGSTGRLFS